MRSEAQQKAMYVEKRPWEASHGELVHGLSGSDVNEAYVDARHVYQRPRHVSEVRKMSFNLTISLTRHAVRVV